MYRLICLIILIIFSQLCAAKITVSVDREPVVVNESFQLTFESDEKINFQPDFSPLKKVLTVLYSTQRSNTLINNNKTSFTQQWILTVLPKNKGQLTIPEINFGKVISSPKTLEVIDAKPANNSNQGDIFIEVEVDASETYVQAQIIYTVRLFRSIPTNNSNLIDPVVSNGQVVMNKLDNDKSYKKTIHGKTYDVFERRYAIFPQNSGRITIEPIIFQAQSGLDSVKFFNLYGPTGEVIVRQSKAIELEVKPIPDTYKAHTWLPAKNITIEEQWSIEPDKLIQGEAATRTLTIKGIGLTASVLPAIQGQLPKHLKQYPDKPEFEETFDGSDSVGIRHDKIAIVPTRSGEIELPAISLPWWDTDENELKYAELPARKIVVEKALVSSTQSSPEMDTESTESSPDVIPEEMNNAQPGTTGDVSGFWRWTSLALFLLWLMTLLLWRFSVSRSDSSEKKPAVFLTKKNAAMKNIQRACSSSNPVQVKEALLSWANLQWPDERITNLSKLKTHTSDNFHRQLDRLNSSLYGQNNMEWNGEDLYNAFKKENFNSGNMIQQEQSRLEPLYKT